MSVSIAKVMGGNCKLCGANDWDMYEINGPIKVRLCTTHFKEHFPKRHMNDVLEPGTEDFETYEQLTRA